MQLLQDYIKQNRTSKQAEVSDVNTFGELYANTKAIYYNVPTAQKPYKVFAFVSVPTTPMPQGGYPAVLLLHGGNGMAYCEFTKQWADNGYVAIAPDLNGCCAKNLGERNIANELGGPNGYGTNLRGDSWLYFSVLSSMSAVDVLCSMDCVNKSKICSCGLSWGGFLNLALVAFEKRIVASSVIYSSAYTHQSIWGQNHIKDLSDEQKTDYVTKVEPCNYLQSVTIPMLFTAGTQDQAFKMINRHNTAKNICGKPYFAIRENFYHGNFNGFEQTESKTFFDCVLNGKPVPAPQIGNGTVKAFANGKLRLLTTNQGLNEQDIQQWTSTDIINGEKITIPSDITAYFVTETTADGETWSTDITIKGE